MESFPTPDAGAVAESQGASGLFVQ
jgi:hypothetical protein